jgi:hypothetical protein
VTTNQLPPELFTENHPQLSYVRRGPPYAVRRLISVVVLLSLIGGGLYWRFGHSSPPNVGEIPTVKAEGPFKQRPQQPGGIDIPHQDVQVYQELDGSGPSKQIPEHLLSLPESPQETAVTPSTLPPSASPPTGQTIEQLIPAHDKAEPVSIFPSPAPSPHSPTERPLDNFVTPPYSPATASSQPDVPLASSVPPQGRPLEAALPNPISQVAQDLETKDTTISELHGPVIQLASVPDEGAARTAMVRLQTKFAAILGATRLHLVQVSLGERGVYYRIQSLVLSPVRARELCAALKNLKSGCIIVQSK